MVFFRDTVGNWLNKPYAKAIVLTLFLVYLGVASWGVTNLQEGLEKKRLSRFDSYSVEYYNVEDEFFREYPFRINVSSVVSPRRSGQKWFGYYAAPRLTDLALPAGRPVLCRAAGGGQRSARLQQAGGAARHGGAAGQAGEHDLHRPAVHRVMAQIIPRLRSAVEGLPGLLRTQRGRRAELHQDTQRCEYLRAQHSVPARQKLLARQGQTAVRGGGGGGVPHRNTARRSPLCAPAQRAAATGSMLSSGLL